MQNGGWMMFTETLDRPFDVQQFDRATIAIRVQQLLSASNASLLTNGLLAMMLAYIQREVVAAQAVGIWLFLVITVALSRFVLAQVLKKLPGLVDSRKQLWWFRQGIFATGTVWGLASVLMFPPTDLRTR